MNRKCKLALKISGAVLALSIIIFAVVCTIIANSVISEMADVRVVRNEAVLTDFGLIGEEITVTTEDGIDINAYIVPNPQSRGNVLILHGMHGMDATSLFDYAKFIYDAGYTPINVDMRAHGKSSGESLSFGYLETLDVLAVIDYLQSDSRYNDLPNIIYGLSMGGSTAINTAAISDAVDGVIAISPFLAYQAQVSDYMLRDGAPGLFVKSFTPFVNLVLRAKCGVSPTKESPEYRASQLGDIPVLIVHGDADSQTAVYQGEALYQNISSNNKEFWLVSGADHLIVDDVLAETSSFYRERIISFLDNNFVD